MSPLETVISSNKTYHPSAPPTALILGGTAGIGRGIASALAQLTGGSIHLIILGRNAAAAQDLFASLPRNESTTYEFEKVDAMAVADIQRVTKVLKARLSKVNFIVLSAGTAGVLDRTPTAEGHLPLLAIKVLARFAFVRDLLPLMAQTEGNGERVGVLYIGAAGHGGAVDLQDIDMKKRGLAKYMATLRPVIATYHDAILEGFSRRYPSVHFTHTFPGFVTTNLFGPLIGSVSRTLRLGIPVDECAQYSLYPILSSDEKYRQGVSRVGERAEDVGHSDGMTEEVVAKVWKYAEQAARGPDEETSSSTTI